MQIQFKVVISLYLVYLCNRVIYFTYTMLIPPAVLEAKLLGLNHIVIYTTVN